jgi:hypothetical protein
VHRKYIQSTHTDNWWYTQNRKLFDAELPQRSFGARQPITFHNFLSPSLVFWGILYTTPVRLWHKGGSVIVKRQVFIGFLLVCLSARAYANPIVFDPVNTIAFTLVLGSAFAVEAAIVTLVLLGNGTETNFWGFGYR